MEPFETFEHAGFTCELHQDTDAESPDAWDNLGTLYAFRTDSRNYVPGETANDAQEAWERERPGLTVRYLRAQGIAAVLTQFQDYGSNGQRILALDDDDDGIANGYIGGNLAKILAEGPVDGDWRRALTSELKNWDSYFQGQVVGYVVRDDAGEVVDSCWGFYPDEDGDGWEYVRSEARSIAEWEAAKREERRQLTAKGWALAHSS